MYKKRKQIGFLVFVAQVSEWPEWHYLQNGLKSTQWLSFNFTGRSYKLTLYLLQIIAKLVKMYLPRASLFNFHGDRNWTVFPFSPNIDIYDFVQIRQSELRTFPYRISSVNLVKDLC